MRKNRLTKPILLSLAIIFSGVAVAVGLFLTRPSSAVDARAQGDRLVRTFRAAPTSHRIAVQAYGTSQADQEWIAVAEVGGRINSMDNFFDDGEVLQEGTVVATIEKQDYELVLKTAETEVSAQEQKQREIAQLKVNLESSIAVRTQQVAIAKKDVDRLEKLVDNNVGSAAEFDRAASTYLERDAALQNLKNELALIPIKKQAADTALAAAELQVSQARRDVERCEIRLPFTALCIARNVDPEQQVAVGRELGRFISVQRARVIAMVEARRALMLFPKLSDIIGTIDLRSQTSSLINELRRQFEVLNIPVDVTWRTGERVANWRGRLARASATVDEATRAIPLIIEVDDAFTAVKLGERPALVPGMFLEVVIYGDVVEDVFVVPRDVVRDGSVYVVREGRLAIVPVHIRALEEQLAVIDSGLVEGDQVVLVDLFPAASGMPLRFKEVDNPVKARAELPPL